MASHDKKSEEIFKFWEDPDNFKLISAAVPLQNLTFEQLVKSHFKPNKDCVPSNDIESKICKILNSDSTKPTEHDADEPAMEAMKPSKAESLKPTVEAMKPSKAESLKPTVPESYEPTESKCKVDKPASQSDKSFEMESLKSAVPEPLKPIESKSTLEVVEPTDVYSTDDINSFVNPDVLEVVNDCDLDSEPYKCIGKLLFFKLDTTGDDDEDPVSYTTAFYIGRNKILTVAHAFDWSDQRFHNIPMQPKHEVIFVPAMGSRYDYTGNLFGYYRALNVRKLKGYTAPTVKEYNKYDSLCDICSADIVPWGRKGEKRSVRSAIDSPEYISRRNEMCDVNIDEQLGDSCIKLSGLVRSGRYDRRNNSSKIFGYAFCPVNVDLKMCILHVTVCPRYYGYLATEGALKGMSGGPWISHTEKIKAFGIQASTEFEKDNQGKQRGVYSFSPPITADTAKRLQVPFDMLDL